MKRGRCRRLPGLVLLAPLAGPSLAQMPAGETMIGHHQMHMDASGSVMNQNSTELPYDCAELGEDVEITVHGGRAYTGGSDGQTFGYSEHEYFAEPCSRVTVTFVNDDAVRHQWMIHGLPKYLYPGGMFHLEAAGGATVSGTFIVPSDNRTYLVHCDMTQHMEQGMKAQLVVGAGSGDLWSIPGISGGLYRDDYSPDRYWGFLLSGLALGFLLTVAVHYFLRGR